VPKGRPVIETERLSLVGWYDTDLAFLARLHGDPAVQRFIDASGAAWTADVLRAKIAAWNAHEARIGYTKWKVVERARNLPVGRAGFEVMPETGETELGFSFVREVWGRGMATEVGSALLDWAWAHTALAEIIGFAHRENAASRRVLEKIGMAERDRGTWNGMPAVVYAAVRDADYHLAR
jgi:ribosomal-protein-alanine N-acetyltransferase